MLHPRDWTPRQLTIVWWSGVALCVLVGIVGLTTGKAWPLTFAAVVGLGNLVGFRLTQQRRSR